MFKVENKLKRMQIVKRGNHFYPLTAVHNQARPNLHSTQHNLHYTSRDS